MEFGNSSDGETSGDDYSSDDGDGSEDMAESPDDVKAIKANLRSRIKSWMWYDGKLCRSDTENEIPWQHGEGYQVMAQLQPGKPFPVIFYVHTHSRLTTTHNHCSPPTST